MIQYSVYKTCSVCGCICDEWAMDATGVVKCFNCEEKEEQADGKSGNERDSN